MEFLENDLRSNHKFLSLADGDKVKDNSWETVVCPLVERERLSLHPLTRLGTLFTACLTFEPMVEDIYSAYKWNLGNDGVPP